MSGYPEPKDYKNIHEFMEKHGDKIVNGVIEESFMEEACDYLLEMATSDLRAAASQLKRLYIHLLKYKFQQNKQTRSWINTIRNASLEVNEALDNKSLANKFDTDSQETIYYHARKVTSSETRLPLSCFPNYLPEDFALNLIRDTVFIEDYLRKYALSIDAKKELDLS